VPRRADRLWRIQVRSPDSGRPSLSFDHELTHHSQGTAVIAGAIPKLDDKVREQVKGVVLFGYTKNQQNNKGIPSLPSDRLKVFCNTGDMVCVGTLVLTAAHFTYQADAAGAAPKFLEEKIGA
jgi:cutinase